MTANEKLLLWLFVILVLVVIFLPICVAQEKSIEILSPSLSFRDSYRGEKFDYEIAITFFNLNNKNKAIFQWERENDFFYREVDIRVEAFGFFFRDYLKESRSINYSEFGYLYDKAGFRAGSSFLIDEAGNWHLMGITEYRSGWLVFKYAKSKSRWLIDSNMTIGKELSRNTINLLFFKFKPFAQILLKYYQDSNRKFRQAKVGFSFSFYY